MGQFKSTERFLKPDVRYNSKLVAKFINCLMVTGKRSISESIFYSMMDIAVSRFPEKAPIEIFEEAINNVKPLLEVRSKRVGGATYQVPIEVPRKRQLSLSIRWILEAARKKKGKSMDKRLADEICDAYRKQGASITKRENTHKMAEANKAFAHFAWSM